MSASINGRALTNGEFVCVIDGVTYVGRAHEWNYRQAALSRPTCTLGGVITDQGPWVAQPEAAPQPAPQPAAHRHMTVQHVQSAAALPVVGDEATLYTIDGVAVAYVYRPSDAGDDLPYKPTDVSAYELHRLYPSNALVPRVASGTPISYRANSSFSFRVTRRPLSIDGAAVIIPLTLHRYEDDLINWACLAAAPDQAPVEPEVPQPQLHVQYVDYNNLPVRGEANCLYVIAPREALGPDVELPCAYVYRPTAYDASPGTLNTLPYQPTNISARAVRASYAQGELFPRPRRNEDSRLLLHRVVGASQLWSTALLLSNEQVYVGPEMLRPVSGPTLAAEIGVPAQNATAANLPADAPMGLRPQLMVQIVPWSQLPVVGDHDTLYCVSGETGGEGREVFEENAYVYRPAGSDDPHPYKATNVSAATVARVHDSGDRLHSVASIVRDSSGVPVCYVTSASTVPREVRTRNDVLAWIPTGWRAIGEIPTRGRPGHLVLPAVSSGTSSISVPQVSPQTARDIMTSGWGAPLASTTLVEELPTHLPAAAPSVIVSGAGMTIAPPRYPITFIRREARELADQMMAEVNDAVAAEADRQFTAAVDAALNTQTDHEVVADLTAAMAEAPAPEPSEPRSRPITVRHVSHHDALPEVGDTDSLYCVFGYPMALVYRVNEPDNFGGLLTAYFPTNVSASLLASMVLDGEAALCLRYDFLMSAGTQIVRFAYDPSETRATDFRMGRLYMLPDSTTARDYVWTNGPWFHSRATPAPADHGPNRNGDVFTNAVNAVNDFTRVSMREDNFFRRLFPATPAAETPDPNVVAYSVPAGFSVPQRRVTGDTHVVDLPIRTPPPTGFEVHLTVGEPAPAATAAPPPAPSRRRLLLD